MKIKIEDILKSLEENNVQYAIVGGLAVVLYGYVRFTADIDFVLELSKENVERFLRAIGIFGFKPGIPIDPIGIANPKQRNEWIEEKNVKVITFCNPDAPHLQIDVLIILDLSQIKTERKKLDDFHVSVVSYDDLIRLKKESNREIDLIDIKKLDELRKMKED